jgi:NTE family protein
MTRNVLLAFEGGGAKGLVHIGALAAIEAPELDVTIVGAAGTSAGAMVAGLIAAGYSAADLIDPVARTSILQTIGLKAMTDVFGRAGWKRVRLIKQWRQVGLIALTGLAVLIMLVASLRPGLEPISLRALASLTLCFLVVGSVLVGAGYGILLAAMRGLATTAAFEKAYDTALHQKLPGLPSGPVTFGGLHRETRRALKVVATCLDTGDVVVYGDQETPDVSVAAAVAASVCLPLVFAPATVEGSTPPGALHYDGGLVSNLPAWTFDEERLLDQDTLTIAFEISDPVDSTVAGRPWSILRWLSATGRAAVFGGSVLNMRGVDRMIAVKLPSRVGVLDFDMTWCTAAEEVANAKAATSTTVGLLLATRPDTLNRACNVIADNIYKSMVTLSGASPPAGLAVRAILAIPYPGSRRLLALPFGAGDRNRSDEAMTLPIEGSLAGAAWTTGTDLFDADPFDARYNLDGEANRRRRSLVWPEVKWRAAIPISTMNKTGTRCTAAVLCLDGNGLAQEAAQSLTSQRLNDVRLALSKACQDVAL